MKKNKRENLLLRYRSYILVPAMVVVIVLAITAGLVVAYNLTDKLVFVFILVGVLVFILASYIVFYIRLSNKIKTTFYKQLYETTNTNLNKIMNNDTNLVPYGETDIKEIAILDKTTSDLKAKLNASFLLVKEPNYSPLNLEYINKEKKLITFKSFKDNLSNIIFISQSFRNVLIEVFFDLPAEAKISDKDKKRLLDLYLKTFKDHQNVLYMFAEDDRSFLIYVPVIDSFSEIKEKLNYVVTDSSIMVREDKGIQNILAKYAIVAYPYSSEEMLLGDLRYAKRLDKPYLLFLPQRYRENINRNLMLNTTMNINYTSKILVELSKLDYSSMDNEKNKTILRNVINAIGNFLDIDEAGIIAYDEQSGGYYSYIASERSTLLNKNFIDKEFVERLADAVDDDQSYYFSTKKHANYAIKRLIDIYGINSGTYYVIKDFENDKISAMVYLFNRNRDLNVNTYLREMFFIISLRIENYFEKREIADYADAKANENDNILALSKLYVYHIDDDYRFTSISKGLKHKFPKLQIGETCHKFFFGNEHPCHDCPLITKNKKYFEDKGDKFETSLVLTNRRDKDNVILVKQLTKDDSIGDLYHSDLLIYSYRALADLIRNEYAAKARGYILLLSIDNYENIIDTVGSEGYSYYLREFIRSIKSKIKTDDIYYFNPSTLAVHLPYTGHADTINKIETIFPYSKANFYQNAPFKELKVTYLAAGYPRGFANPEDFLKLLSDLYHNPKYERNKDFIYFADYSIYRSANKREFIISVLEQEFSGHNSTSMNLQPIVSLKDGHIFGAEILLRIADVHRNVFFNAVEISRIAEQENKTQLVTESIINFIGNMYQEYGNNIFKINKFNRIAINIDQTYLKDQSLLSELVKLSEKNKLPAGFISMEIPEDVIPNNKEQIKKLADELSKYKIMFSCDRYLGQYVNIDELYELGFKEVKVARDLVLTIDKDPVKFNAMKAIVDASKKVGIGVAAVGVENEQQLKLLKSIDENIMAQGYYLYKPLTRSDLIAALISYEK